LRIAMSIPHAIRKIITTAQRLSSRPSHVPTREIEIGPTSVC
jgi:hypothetical protein